MTGRFRVGVIGARGYVGRELIALIDRHPHFDLAFASSREWDGLSVAEAMPDIDLGTATGEAPIRAMAAEDAAREDIDLLFLGLPNGHAAPFVESFDKAGHIAAIVDLSGDHRHHPGFAYGLPERFRDRIAGSKRIANPGCYATAAHLAIAPLRKLVSGRASVVGISGWSGAGTSPSRKNDSAALADNVIPYGLVGHAHEKEIAAHSGIDVGFSPVVANFFRGLCVIAHADLADGVDAEQVIEAYRAAYADEPFVRRIGQPAEPAMAAGTFQCVIGAPQVSLGHMVATAALDNLLKGAASQAIQNANLALGLTEGDGLPV